MVRTPTKEQTANLMAWRSMALDTMPYYAAMLFSLRVLDAPGLGTFACDAQHRLYIDFEAVSSWTPGLCSQALLHECGHLFGEHGVRATDAGVRDEERRMWNTAGDAEINDDLRDAGCDELVSNGVLPERIGCEDYQTAESYMEALRKKRQQSQRQQRQSGGQGQGNGQDKQGGTGQSDGQQGQGQSQGGGQSEAKSGKPYVGCGSGAGTSPAPGELDADDDLDGAATPATVIERKRVRIATASSIREHAAKGRGTVPAGLVDAAEQILAPPKVPWRHTLSAAIRRGVAQRQGDYDSTYSRRHRRTPSIPFGNAKVVRPGTFAPVPTLAVVRDTSGSMSADDLNTATSEIEGIARQIGVRGRDLRVFDTDAAVGAVRDYRSATSIAEAVGRGGTDMRVGIKAAVEQKVAPSAVIVISDGGTPWPDEKLPVPLVICLVPQAEGQDMSPLVALCPEWAVTVVAQD